ncbi:MULTISPECIES: DUF1972 domain-containing protein [unclassified Pseudonocardia]|uniref:DUF1972 domain-containing protein n=1 Tax=unclassified Pseudonocardia TaxID=2619320 RepID=UPI0002D2C526|nr:DUF1972 domain-containing protein [Pseudonocardia sp. Ae707_Ps1]
MHISMIGTRGVPARYGGFETAVEEIGRRLADRGHQVTVYCRGRDDASTHHLGMRRVVLPSLRGRSVETLSHTFLSVLHAVRRRHQPDVALVFNAANAPLIIFLKILRIPVAVHVDGLEWRRAKWGRAGRTYYLLCERFAARMADALIADARGIEDYYRRKYGVGSDFIAYGAPEVEPDRPELLDPLGLEAGRYHLVVARMEPENHVDVIVDGYTRSGAVLPLVVVGSVPYETEYNRRVADLAAADERVQLVGAVWDQDLLDQLYANCASYLHGHSVGGTNPSLLRAMGAGAYVVAWDVDFNREIVRDDGSYFGDATAVAERVEDVEAAPDRVEEQGRAGKKHVLATYAWEAVTEDYEALARRLDARGRDGAAGR